MTASRLLVIDDGLDYARIVDTHLEEYELVRPTRESGPDRIPNGPAAIEFLAARHRDVDCVLLDMRFDLPAEELLPLSPSSSQKNNARFQGVAILRAIRDRWPDLPVVLLTAQRDLALADVSDELAAQSMTYVLDGDDLDTLRIRIAGALRAARDENSEGDVYWGTALANRVVRRHLRVLCRGSMPILLEGETGTGKSYLARTLIHCNSQRTGPFVVADLSTIPRDLVASYLFGSTRGAFTGAVSDREGVFAEADGGTLFLDEIQNTPLEVQRQLLVVLQERRIRPLGAAKDRTVDVKLIAASNAPLRELVARGEFRQDLYMRLGPATRVRLPALRERRVDIPFLAEKFVEKAASHPDVAPLLETVASSLGAKPTLRLNGPGAKRRATDGLELALPEAAWKSLNNHEWPGNIRELEFVVHNLVAFTLFQASDALEAGADLSQRSFQIDPGLVGELLDNVASLTQGSTVGDAEGIAIEVHASESLNAVSVDVERQYFLNLFERYGGDFSRMAEHLLGNGDKARAVQLRFNQIGLKVRQIKKR